VAYAAVQNGCATGDRGGSDENEESEGGSGGRSLLDAGMRKDARTVYECVVSRLIEWRECDEVQESLLLLPPRLSLPRLTRTA
jgi:hypothetical protein